jgi:transglutaminase-like putative cysteine protease
LPNETLVFLLGSRYCETDKLADIAWRHFGSSPRGWRRVQAICDFVCGHLTFGYEHARATRTLLKPIKSVSASAAISPISRSLSAAA